MDGQDRIEIVTFLLHSALIKIAAWLHSNESHSQKDTDFFNAVFLDMPVAVAIVL